MASSNCLSGAITDAVTRPKIWIAATSFDAATGQELASLICRPDEGDSHEAAGDLPCADGSHAKLTARVP